MSVFLENLFMGTFDFSYLCSVWFVQKIEEVHTQLQTCLGLNDTLIVQEDKSSEQLSSITFNFFYYKVSRHFTVSTVTNFPSSNIGSNG